MKLLILAMLFFSISAHAEKIADFNLPIYSQDKKFQLSENLKNKKVFINFWATWCISCIQEMPLLEKLKEQYGNDVVFVAVNAGEATNLIDRFMRKHKFSFIILKDEDRAFSKSVGVDSLPVSLVIDKDMNVVYRGITPPKEL